jgi:phage gpG-like protein
MTPEELPAYLRRMKDRVSTDAPVAAANAMAQTYQGEVVRSMKGHGDDPSPPGTPPARKTGTLARSVRAEPAVSDGPGRAKSSTAPHTVYARIQQLGGVIKPVRAKALHWGGTPFGPLRKGQKRDPGVFAKRVKLPARPYMVMTPATRQKIHDAAKRAIAGVLGG